MDIKSPDSRQNFSTGELEQFLLFAVAVTGKTAKIVERQMAVFLSLEQDASTPFDKVSCMLRKRRLRANLKRAKLGQYTKLCKSYRQIVSTRLDLRTCTVEELEAIHGIGAKTSRFFILHTRPNQRLAVLDTHILKYLRLVYDEEVAPQSTPAGKAYAYWETKFLRCADDLGMSPAELDSQLWTWYSSHRGT